MSAQISVLDDFDGTDGKTPNASLIVDADGDLFGTTDYGGSDNDGTVFEITYSPITGYASTPDVLVSFDETDGAAPMGSLITDAQGDLFGTTDQGGADSDGTVFEIPETATGYAGTPTILVSFDGTDGDNPKGSLITDAQGDLFGTTFEGGTANYGTAFEIAETASGYASTPTTLVSFSLTSGIYPAGDLITDAQGDLFGTTETGGTSGDGTVFEIAKTPTGYAATPTVLVDLDGSDGDVAEGSLVADAQGNLFGTAVYGGTYAGGAYIDVGSVFEIARTAGGYASTPTLLVTFNGTDGIYPLGGLIIDAAGDLFGTTDEGGANNDGTVFEIAKTATGYATTATTVYSFDGTDGAKPGGNLTADAEGDLLGTTAAGGTNGDGTVFKLTQTGFVVAPEVFSQVQAAASYPLAGNYLWSNAANWTDGVPVNGDSAASHAAGIDDLAALTLNNLDLTAGGTVSVAGAGILGIEALTGDATTRLFANSTLPASATTATVIVDSLAATGGTYGAIGPGALFSDISATSPADASYAADDGGALDITNDLAIGGAAAGTLSVAIGGTATSANGTIGTGTANAGSAIVDGAGSSWVMRGSLVIGVQGGGGTPSLTIADDASVSTTANVASYDVFFDGLLTIETGAKLTEASLDMHNAATLVVESGATLTETGDSNTAALDANGLVTFDDATLASAAADTATYIGLHTDTGGSGVGAVTASDGSTATSYATALGQTAGDSGTLILTGAATTWTDTADTPVDKNNAGIDVGESGSGSLTVAAGAVLANPLAYIKIGQFEGSAGTALVTGTGSTLSAGGLLRVGDSGAGTLNVENGAAVSAGQVQVSDYGSSTGVLDVDSGASLTTDSASTVDVGSQLAINGTIQVAAGSFEIGVQSGSHGQVDVDGGSVIVQGDLTVGDAGAGSLSVENGGAVLVVNADIGAGTGAGSVTLGTGGILAAAAVHVGAQGTVNMAGGVLDPPDQITIDAAGGIAGFGTIAGSLADGGNVTAAGGTLDLTGDVSGSGTLGVAAAASLQLEGTIADTAGIVFTGSGGTLVLGANVDIATTVNGLGSGNSVALEGQSVATALYDPATGDLAITGDGGAVFNLSLSGIPQQSNFSVVDGELNVACFLEGTRLATAHGHRRVEDLAIGDRVQTRSAGLARVRWIGHRHIDCRRHPRPETVWPVRVATDAFGPGLPHRDLWLSPDHAVFAEDVLIPIRQLINGTTIVQAARDEVTYWHVELERHEVVFAEGLPCETYLDTGNRRSFANGGVAVRLHPDFAAGGDETIWEAAACAPLRIAGEAVARVAALLRRRARALGHGAAGKVPRRRVPDGGDTADLAALLRPDWYLAAYRDVAASGMDAAAHYAGWGRAEGRLPCPEIELVRGLGLIDSGTLIFSMADVVAAGADPAEHFCATGWRERRRPNTYFDTGWYLDTHDIPGGMNPLLHYLLTGECQNLSPSAHFDPSWYRQRYALGTSVSPLAHYLRHRRTQRVSPLPAFDVAAYVTAHAGDLLPNRDPYAHYLAIGRFASADAATRSIGRQA